MKRVARCIVCLAIVAALLSACGDDSRELYRELNAMKLERRPYGEAYGLLTNAGFDCGDYRFDRGVSMQSLAEPLAMQCHRHLHHSLGCDTSQILRVRGSPETWRIESVAPWSGPACH